MSLKCRCGKEKDGGRSYCPDCLQKLREYQRKYDSKKRELKQPRNCPDCGVELTQPPSGGRPRHRCPVCDEKLSAEKQLKLKRDCLDCGTEIPLHAGGGRPRQRCLKCANEAVIRSSTAYRERNISLGKCPCGKKSQEGRSYCPDCLRSHREYQRKYNRRKAAKKPRTTTNKETTSCFLKKL